MEQWLDDARESLKADRLDDAARSCERALADAPDNPAALHLAGLVALRRGEIARAADLLRRAIVLRPASAIYQNNLGVALRAAGCLLEAEQAFRRALELRPAYADAHSNLGSLLCGDANRAEAEACLRAALAIDPRHADAHYNLANLLAARGDHANAVEHYEQAIEARPGWSEPWNNLGNAFLWLDQLDEAARAYRRAIELNPQSFAAYNNLGLAALRAGDADSARWAWQQAADRRSHLAHAEREDHSSHLAPQVEMRADPPQISDSLHPQPAPLWRFRAQAVCPTVFASMAEIEDYRHQLSQLLEEYSDGPPLFSDLDDLPTSGAEPPYNLLFHGLDNRPLKECYAALFARSLNESSPHAPREERQPLPHIRSRAALLSRSERATERKRLAFLVTPLHEPIFIRWMAGLLDRLDRRTFAVTIVCSSGGRARIARAVRNAQTDYLLLPERLSVMIEALRNARFDLLHYWEIGSDTVNYALPFFRLAPIQTTSLGVQDTSGIEAVDSVGDGYELVMSNFAGDSDVIGGFSVID
jgi:tetratricopeptide (TPR) repeat protein